MALVAGIDLSTHAIDVVTVDEDTGRADWRKFELAGPDAWERSRRVRDAVYPRGWWKDSPVIAIGIERPFGPSSGLLNIVLGGVLATIPTNLLVQPWQPSAWRKKLGIRRAGGTWKDAARDYAEHHCAPITWDDDNAYDAYCIALATLQSLERAAA